MMNTEDRLTRVQKIVADCLQLDPAEVTAERRLFADLGADSLDYVEMVFNLEKEFGVKIGNGDLGYLARLDMTDPEVIKDGFVTSAALAKFRPWLPSIDTAADPARLTPADLWSLVTVGTLVSVIDRLKDGEGAVNA
jgi:acyl carrier protein